jgi:hypothetical protein
LKKILQSAGTMDRAEKLHLSADADTCCCFKQGMFARFYEHSLYWFTFSVKALKPMLEAVKGGAPILYGGLPIASFEKLLAEGALQQVETTDYGWRWLYAGQKPLPGDVPSFAGWREKVLAETGDRKMAVPQGVGWESRESGASRRL